MSTIFLLTLRALGRGRRVLVIAVLLAVPSLLSVAYLASEPHGDGTNFAASLFSQLMLPILLPLTALVFATSALGGEVEDRTLVYLTLKPISRLSVALAKALAATLIVLVLVEVALAAATLIATRGASTGQQLSATMVAGAAGCLTYCSVFLLLGLAAPRRALVAGLVYVLGWEGAAAGLSTALASLSIRHYVQGIFHAGLGSSPLAALQPAAADATTSVVALAVLTVLGLALSTAELRRMELP